MMCYKDRTYCNFFLLCKTGHDCDRALTNEVAEGAKKAGLYISQYAEFPDCFIRFFEDEPA